jgi:6,7-dimethyl-8-ribityllumazine synthase
MLVLLTSRYVARTKEDVEVLQRIFAALGLEGGPMPQSPEGSSSSIRAQFIPSLHCFEILSGSGASADSDFYFHVSDPHLALQLVKNSGAEMIPGSDEGVAQVGFRVKLPSGARVQFGVLPGVPDLDLLPGLSGGLNAIGKRFAIVVSRFNAFITERLLQGAYDGLLRSGAQREDIVIVRVPGAFEIPSASRKLAETKKYDALLCIGCLLRGDTAHYDVIVNEVTRGIGQSAQETGVPHAFGVLTCDTLEQAIDRAGLKMGNKGLEAATAAIEMANLSQSLRGSAGASENKRARKKTAKPASRRKSRRKEN